MLALAAMLCPVLASADGASEALEEVVTIGSKADIDTITGAAHLIDEATLDKFEYSDIQRISREVPGVSIQIEDGYGLRPNISIRGVATERSGRITLLEDNVLIAPAPYSAPSAYYFPTAGRMQSFEVVKGPAAITQGPYTIGGALNMVSTAIPAERKGKLMMEVGQDSTARVHAVYGDRTDSGFAYLLEAHQWQSDGFQQVDRSSTDTGLDVTDYMVKLAYAPEGSAHSVELKLQKADQDSNQSYLGLTDADFRRDADRRYGLSELDTISTAHEQAILRYRFEFSESLSFSATAYNNTHERDWFKTEGMDLDGSDDAQAFAQTSWSNIIQAINLNDEVDGFSSDQLQAILDGSLDTAAGSIQLRSNAREYYSRGLQLNMDWAILTGEVKHTLEAGIRYHEDEEDRLQRNSTYQQLAGKLVLNDVGELGNAGNRVQQAEAVALYAYDRIEFGDWVFTPGFRYESIDQNRTRFTGGVDRVVRDGRENHTSVLLPGFGAIYRLNDSLSLVAGVHKGFTAPSNSPGVREEEAINTEFGLRYVNDNTRLELMAFISDYQNLLGECTASSGTGCEVGDAFNGDAAKVRGIEALFSNRVALANDLNLTTLISYTYIDGEFDTNIADTAFFGDVSAGDPIPYIPENQLQLSLGIEGGKWQVNANLSYVDEVCTRASCGDFEQTESSSTLDLAAQYYWQDNIKLFSRLENLTDERDIMGRQPYGARPNKSRTASIGVELTF
ncbi:Fe(3+) dicitrate transport protein [Arenicella xantha]|uniref:Fe(3+) dicitrate transport protein n=1 Tax=Arenicella xantha TaxID=644221 RepID=A0A395JGW1_9GAMM|nr:Fe(3+) dicitrate transport protein [Arenicella xantha]